MTTKQNDRRPATKRRYSDEEKAQALAILDACGGDVSKAARQAGVPRKTLGEWANGRAVVSVVAEIRQEKKAELSERLAEVAHKLVDAIPGKVSDATLQQVATSLGITIDKMQLLKGEPTAINANLTDVERTDRVVALLDAARARRAS